MAKIRHIAIVAKDPEKLAEFYADIYGMTITGRSQGDVWVTDGYMDVAVIHENNIKKPTALTISASRSIPPKSPRSMKR